MPPRTSIPTMDEMVLQLVQIIEPLSQLCGDLLENDNTTNGQAQSVLAMIKHLYETLEQHHEELKTKKSTLPTHHDDRDMRNDDTDKCIALASSTPEDLFKKVRQLNPKLTDENFDTLISTQEKILTHVAKLDQALLDDTQEPHMQGVLGYLTEETLNLGDQLDRFENKLESTDRRMRSLRDLFVRHGNEFSDVLKLLTEVADKLNVVEERSRYTLGGSKNRELSLDGSNLEGTEMDMFEEQLKNYSGKPPLWNSPALEGCYSEFASGSSVSVSPSELGQEFENICEHMKVIEPVGKLTGNFRNDADIGEEAYPERNQTSEKDVQSAMSAASMLKSPKICSDTIPFSSRVDSSSNTRSDSSEKEIVEANSNPECTHPPAELQAGDSTPVLSPKSKTEQDARNLRGNLWSQKPQTWTNCPQESRCNSLSILDAETLNIERRHCMLESSNDASSIRTSFTADGPSELPGGLTCVSGLWSEAGPPDLPSFCHLGSNINPNIRTRDRPVKILADEEHVPVNNLERPQLYRHAMKGYADALMYMLGRVKQQNDRLQPGVTDTRSGPCHPLGRSEQEPRHEVEPIPGPFIKFTHPPKKGSRKDPKKVPKKGRKKGPKKGPSGGPRHPKPKGPKNTKPPNGGCTFHPWQRNPEVHTAFTLTERGYDSVEEQQAEVIQNFIEKWFELSAIDQQNTQPRRVSSDIASRQYAAFSDFLNEWYEAQASQDLAFVANGNNSRCANYHEDELFMAAQYFPSCNCIDITQLMKGVCTLEVTTDSYMEEGTCDASIEDNDARSWRNHNLFLFFTMVSVVSMALVFRNI
ncbi:hypothetical protein BJ875DRAFT_480208 [Amylocarpus encephaloides]|uniref:Uncharacterized protein n=1 Tax=Amylocarpus encephaloides TaxID=45428 RepID=A0A9P7YRN8_9HELO|nr:hypothetical protein BJ875DRAFT_480208 [Amylocarpus encephaloides]